MARPVARLGRLTILPRAGLVGLRSSALRAGSNLSGGQTNSAETPAGLRRGRCDALHSTRTLGLAVGGIAAAATLSNGRLPSFVQHGISRIAMPHST